MTPATFAQRNLLLKLTLKAFRATRKDRRATKDLADSKSAEVTHLSVVKRLVPETLFKPVYTHDRETYRLFNSSTLPWCDGTEDSGGEPATGEPSPSGRICRASVFATLMQTMGERERSREPLVRQAVTEYGALLAQPEVLQQHLGDLYRAEDYPGVDKVRRQFAFALRVLPVPGSDWRMEMQSEELAEVRRMAEEQTHAAATAAERRLIETIADPLKRVLAMLQKPEGERQILSSTMRNLAEMAARIDALNVTENPLFGDIATVLKQGPLAASAEALRDSARTRHDARQTAQAVLDKLSSLTGEAALGEWPSADPDATVAPEPDRPAEPEFTPAAPEDNALAVLLSM